MRSRLARFVLASWLVIVIVPRSAYTQSQDSQEISRPSIPCPSPQEEPSPSQEISIANVTFSGFIQMPVSDQDDIASAIERNEHGSDLDGLLEEALERVKTGWQDRGYFKVKVSGDARIATKTADNTQIALFVHVDENSQYRLGRIEFKNNNAISNSAALRALFPVKDGDIFSREKITKGLENLRKAYGEYGYINYTGVPVTTFDDEKKLAYLDINVDEGKQFYVTDIDFQGLDQPSRQRLMKEFAVKPGDIYNGRLWELSISRIPILFPSCTCTPSRPAHLDERAGAVVMTVDLRSCLAK